MKIPLFPRLFRALILILGTGFFASPAAFSERPDPAKLESIKAYCLDFNWQPTNRRGRGFAKPGRWANADPAEHVAWYKAMGANVIQTFCVPTNGYAWYRGGPVPPQPGMQHDFLTEVVRLGHQEGMLVMGYFCISANTLWGETHPDQSYGTPSTYHIPFTDDYLAYISASISDAVTRTGIDGFMIDWTWMPKRQSTEGKWLESEKKLYQQLMGEAFPGEEHLTAAQDTAYSRKAIDRCWRAIHTAAKQANPDCIIWLTVNKINHPHVVDSAMYREVDWLMNEAGSVEAINRVRGMVGDHTRMITCMAMWNGQDPTRAVPEAMDAGIGLYGFTSPHSGSGVIALDPIFSQQVSELSGDPKNIAVLARAYHGVSMHAEWKQGAFVEPKVTPPLEIRLKGRGRGWQDTARLEVENGTAIMAIKTPYDRGRAVLSRTGDTWPQKTVIRWEKKPGTTANPSVVLLANGRTGFRVQLPQEEGASVTVHQGAVSQPAEMRGSWTKQFFDSPDQAVPVQIADRVQRSEASLDIILPSALLDGSPPVIVVEWIK